eukprot:4611232-Pyramimonas_sp.AAC.1
MQCQHCQAHFKKLFKPHGPERDTRQVRFEDESDWEHSIQGSANIPAVRRTRNPGGRKSRSANGQSQLAHFLEQALANTADQEMRAVLEAQRTKLAA